MIEYNFQGLYVTSRFKTVIRFSEEFRGCLTDDDFDQQLEVSIDPAFLAKYDLVQELSFGEINGGNKINVPPAAKGALGIKGWFTWWFIHLFYDYFSYISTYIY